MSTRCSIQTLLVCTLLNSVGIAVADDRCLSSDTPDLLDRHRGNYLASSLVEKILKARNVFKGQADWEHGVFAQAIFVKGVSGALECEDGVSGTNWHESGVLVASKQKSCSAMYGEPPPNSCVLPIDSGRMVLKIESRIQEIYEKVNAPPADFLFQKLFNGCYEDELRKKICFQDSKMRIDGAWKAVELLLDSSELAQEGNYVRVDDGLFWVFVPMADGWNVYKSDWMTASDYAPVDLNKPWKTLRRESEAK